MDEYKSSLDARDAAAGLSTPGYWGFHPYADVDNRHKQAMADFRARMPAGKQFWLTEVGSRVDSNCKNQAGAFYQCNTAQQQADDATYLFDTSAPAADVKVNRIYYYQWREPNTTKKWDSGLVSPSGTARPVYTVLKNHT